MNTLRCLLALTFTTAIALGQSSPRIVDYNNHGWFSYSGDHPVSKHWGIHLDAQWRRHNLITRWQQYQLRPGVNFYPTDSVMVTVGYAFTRSYPYGDFPAARAFPEHRLYERLRLSHKAGRVRISHRYRLEQRFIGRFDEGNERGGVDRWNYQNRFRYQVKASIPLVQENGKMSWYLPLSNEVFVNFGPNFGASIFDQNRATVGVGYDFGSAGQLEFGYLNQLIAQSNGRILESNNTIFVSFSSELPLFGARK